LYRGLPAQRTPEAGSSRWPIDHAGRAQDRPVSCGPRNSSVTGRAVTIAVGVVYTRPSPASSNGVACRGAYPDHTHAELRQTQPSRVSAGRVCVPQVGHAIGAPIFSNFVASAESSGAARRGPRAGTFSPIVIDPLSPKSDQVTHTARRRERRCQRRSRRRPEWSLPLRRCHTRGRRTGGTGRREQGAGTQLQTEDVTIPASLVTLAHHTPTERQTLPGRQPYPTRPPAPLPEPR